MLLVFVEMPLARGGNVIISVGRISSIQPAFENERHTLIQLNTDFVIVAVPFEFVRIKVQELTQQLWEEVRQK